MNASGGGQSHIDPIGFNFNSSSASRQQTGRGLSRPRMAKLRKHTTNPLSNSRPTWLNPFTTAEDVAVENIRRLSIGDEYYETLGIEKDLRRLNVHGESIREKPGLGFQNAGNSDVESEHILDKIKKLDLEDGADIVRETHVGQDDEHILPREIENKLNIGKEKDYFSFSGNLVNIVSDNAVREPPVFSSTGNVSDGFPDEKLENNCEFVFKTKQHSSGPSVLRSTTQIQKVEQFSAMEQTVEGSFKSNKTALKKKSFKIKQPTIVHLWSAQDFVSSENSLPSLSAAEEECSPMEISPCRETVDEAMFSRESSVHSQESVTHGIFHAAIDSYRVDSNASTNHDHSATAQSLNVHEEVLEFSDSNSKISYNASSKILIDDSVSAVETESFKSANEELECISDCSISGESEINSSSINKDVYSTSTQFFSSGNAQDYSSSSFTFAATSPLKGPPVRHKKKNQAKVMRDSFSAIPDVKTSHSSSSYAYTPVKDFSLPIIPPTYKKTAFNPPSRLMKDKFDLSRMQEHVDDNYFHVTASVEAQEACDKWRLRGNQAYNCGELLKAEECYTEGINSIPKSETSRNCLKALVLCYSNLAATHMSLGRVRDALRDCQLAASLDPTFFRVQLRAANCCLALGEVDDALGYFSKCLKSEKGVSVDRKIYMEASDGLQKTQKASQLIQQYLIWTRSEKTSDRKTLLEVLSEALAFSPYSEKLLEAKAECLFVMRKYENVIFLCQQSLDSAEKNACKNDHSHRFWRSRLTFLSSFYIGRLDDAATSLEEQEKLTPLMKGASAHHSQMEEPLQTLAKTVQELLRYKADGNEAYNKGKLLEAIEMYTVALSRNTDSRPFAAVCFCNRAAAYKSLGQIVDAIADCNLAIALDGSYVKALSRRATLYEMIRDYNQAACDLRRLLTIASTHEKNGAENLRNLSQDRIRLSVMEEEARKEIPLDFYLILGVETCASQFEIKKAYHKAALRHHPDKACQSLPKSDTGDEGVWKEIGEEVHKNADKLFKIIGESYAVLSDQFKRSNYDLEEEARNVQKKYSGSSLKTHSFPFERTDNGRQWRDSKRG